MTDESEKEGSITATVELSGEYEAIADIIGGSEDRYPELAVVGDDLAAVLDVLVRTGGATKSQLVADLPGDLAGAFDADNVVHALRVLAAYDLVRLDGNTWRPGPALAVESAGAEARTQQMSEP